MLLHSKLQLFKALAVAVTLKPSTGSRLVMYHEA